MAKKKNKKVEIEKKPTPLTEEQKQQTARMIGFVAGLFSKFMLKAGGCEVDFKINGEDISDIEKLHGLDITARIELAVTVSGLLPVAAFQYLILIEKHNLNESR